MSKRINTTDILIISSQPFPYGEAATNRIISYAKVLAEDYEVMHITLTPDFFCNPNNLSKGSFTGIKYEYATGDNEWNPYWPKWKKGLKLLKGKINIYRLINKYRPKVVILLTRNLGFTKRILCLSKILKFRLILEITELTRFKTDNLKDMLSTYSKVDGILCISREIIDFLKPISSSVNLFHLPMSVDIDRFPVDCTFDKTKDRYFAICSGNNWERDGAIDSINAFLKFRKDHPDFFLKIAGIINDKTDYNRRFKEIVESNSMNGVIYEGRLSSDRIPDFIMGATATLMTPHKNYESGGFPTKLGEYLASGVPVICTSVSEIPQYLSRNNSYICPPNDIRSIVQSMIEIARNPEVASAVGRMGRLVAETSFNVSTYKPALIEFLLRPKSI